MSNERSGFPGMAIAVTHVVWVVSGGVKTHCALAPVAASDVAATAPDRHASSLDRVVMDVSSNMSTLAIGLTGDGGLSLIDVVPLGACARVNFCELHSFFRTYFGLWRSSISENQPSLGGLLAPFVAAGVTEGSITFVGGTPVIRLLLGASGSPPGAGSARVAARSPSL
jgi:hypothetical protein